MRLLRRYTAAVWWGKARSRWKISLRDESRRKSKSDLWSHWAHPMKPASEESRIVILEDTRIPSQEHPEYRRMWYLNLSLKSFSNKYRTDLLPSTLNKPLPLLNRWRIPKARWIFSSWDSSTPRNIRRRVVHVWRPFFRSWQQVGESRWPAIGHRCLEHWIYPITLWRPLHKCCNIIFARPFVGKLALKDMDAANFSKFRLRVWSWSNNKKSKGEWKTKDRPNNDPLEQIALNFGILAFVQRITTS